MTPFLVHKQPWSAAAPSQETRRRFSLSPSGGEGWGEGAFPRLTPPPSPCVPRQSTAQSHRAPSKREPGLSAGGDGDRPTGLPGRLAARIFGLFNANQPAVFPPSLANRRRPPAKRSHRHRSDQGWI